MKDFVLLRWSDFNHYRHIIDHISKSNLRFLVNFFSGDYKSYDQDVFIRCVNLYNAHFVYNDLKNKIFYIGCSEWELDEEIEAPSREEFPDYINETNSCKLTYDNFIELAEKLMDMKKHPTPFAIIYRDDNDWVNCKGFDSQEEMELFVKNYQPEVTH